jgi:hypothetical protein
MYKRVVEMKRKWGNIDDRNKISHTMLWIFYKKIMQRIEALWNGDIEDNMNDEIIWYKFNIKCINIEKIIKVAEEDWNKFKSINKQIFVMDWKEEKIITEEEANNLKDLDVFMNKIFSKGGERICLRQAIERYQTWIDLALDGYDLKKKIFKDMAFKEREQKKVVWHKMNDLKFPEDEVPELENHRESITINGSLTIFEDEFEQKTIWRRKIPTKKYPIYIATRIEKTANECM